MSRSIQGLRDLVAATGEAGNGYVDITVQWNDDDVRSDAVYHIYSRLSGGRRIYEGSTRNSEFTIREKEFWTEYEIIVEISSPSKQTLKTKLFTGPGGKLFHHATVCECDFHRSGEIHGELTRNRKIMPYDAAPHSVRSFTHVSSTHGADCEIVDAFMPRVVDRYHVRHCHLAECRNFTLKRGNHDNVSLVL